MNSDTTCVLQHKIMVHPKYFMRLYGIRIYLELGMVVHTCDLSTEEAEVGGL